MNFSRTGATLILTMALVPASDVFAEEKEERRQEHPSVEAFKRKTKDELGISYPDAFISYLKNDDGVLLSKGGKEGLGDAAPLYNLRFEPVDYLGYDSLVYGLYFPLDGRASLVAIEFGAEGMYIITADHAKFWRKPDWFDGVDPDPFWERIKREDSSSWKDLLITAPVKVGDLLKPVSLNKEYENFSFQAFYSRTDESETIKDSLLWGLHDLLTKDEQLRKLFPEPVSLLAADAWLQYSQFLERQGRLQDAAMAADNAVNVCQLDFWGFPDEVPPQPAGFVSWEGDQLESGLKELIRKGQAFHRKAQLRRVGVYERVIALAKKRNDRFGKAMAESHLSHLKEQIVQIRIE